MRHIEKACTMLQESNNYKHILEFGVYRGETVTIIKNTVSINYEIYGFDSFEGLPDDWCAEDGKVVCQKGFFTNDGQIPVIDGVTFYKGWFDNTLPDYLKIAEPISLLHVDCDLYSSTKTVLYGLNNFIKEGTIIVFDEWFYDMPQKSNHEQKCFYEWVKDCNREYEFVLHTDNSVYGSRNEQQIVKILK